MKTYFMAWESDNKRGHSIREFDINDSGDEITPRLALRQMIDSVDKEFRKAEIPLEGIISATQFNLVE